MWNRLHSLTWDAAELRRRAEERARTEIPAFPQDEDPHRVLHELQVHQIQLEMQNEEMREARVQLETLLEKYTDLYDFAPVGYFSLDPDARIKEVNLTGAAILGIERSQLVPRKFSSFVTPASHSTFKTFLRETCEGDEKMVCEVGLKTITGDTLWVNLQGTHDHHSCDGESLCRIAVSDITALKRAVEAQSRAEALQVLNEALEKEVAQRKVTEKSLRESKRRQSRLLVESESMQEQLRLLSHQVLHAQEVERKRISRDLHDEIAQTLAAINVQLSSLACDPEASSSRMQKKIEETKELVAQSGESVHRFAMGLRPTMLDDLGLVPALRACARTFMEQTELPVHLELPSTLKPLGDCPAVTLYRVAQAALSNVARHAEATKVMLTLRQTQRTLILTIADNGKAFDVKRLPTQSGKKVERLGLVGMKERTEMIGAHLNITSTPGKGTTVCVQLPLTKASVPPFPPKRKENT